MSAMKAESVVSESEREREGWEEVQDLDEPILLRWPYLLHPPLDHVDIWIYGSSHTHI